MYSATSKMFLEAIAYMHRDLRVGIGKGKRKGWRDGGTEAVAVTVTVHHCFPELATSLRSSADF